MNFKALWPILIFLSFLYGASTVILTDMSMEIIAHGADSFLYTNTRMTITSFVAAGLYGMLFRKYSLWIAIDEFKLRFCWKMSPYRLVVLSIVCPYTTLAIVESIFYVLSLESKNQHLRIICTGPAAMVLTILFETNGLFGNIRKYILFH
jgi:hypothetical protein